MTSYTAKISEDQGKRVRRYLEDRGFSFSQPQYTHFSAKSRELVVSHYQSGKLLLQGRGTSDFVEFFLEPEILKSATVGYELELDPAQLTPHIGVDESGKGDFFGPLVVAAAYVNADAARALAKAGIQDSKNIKSDRKMADLDKIIANTPGCVSDVVVIGNDAYNRLYAKFRNLNNLLAWGHARAMENVLAKLDASLPAPEFILSDQFARSKSTVEKALQERARSIKLIQKTKAESDIAVAAASVRARARFVDQMSRLGQKVGITLPKGASAQVDKAARAILSAKGQETLDSVCKTHFLTHQRALIASGQTKK